MSAPLPPSTRKIQVHTLSHNFREATRIISAPLPSSLSGDQVLVRNHFVGINASDINFTAGKYTPGVKPPFDAGFESIGIVEAVGPAVAAAAAEAGASGTAAGGSIRVGQAVAATSYGAFSEYQIFRARTLLPLPNVDPQYLPLLVSGLTASIALEQTGEMKIVGVKGAKQETVLVTAAAGATGLFAVQLAKLAGHHVVATCSSEDKVAVLRSLGADRVVNYRTESLSAVLKKEYPRGVDIVYESVGGEMFMDCVRNLAVKGRCIVIGFVSGYQDGSAWKATNPAAAAATKEAGGGSKGSAASSSAPAAPTAAAPKPSPPLPALILGKSASIRGFFLNDYGPEFKRHMSLLTRLIREGKLRSIVDGGREFQGLEQVADAIEYLYKGSNVGKIVVDLAPELHKDGSKQQQMKSKL